ncbi:MAG: hypothetical protein V1773_11245 [bacterium]
MIIQFKEFCLLRVPQKRKYGIHLSLQAEARATNIIHLFENDYSI